MESTDTWMFALQDGICVGAAWKQAGPGSGKVNAQTVSEWAKRGRDIVYLHKNNPRAKALYDQLWDNAKRLATPTTPADADG